MNTGINPIICALKMRLLVFNYDNYVYYQRYYIISVTAGRINRLLHQLVTPFSQSVSIV